MKILEKKRNKVMEAIFNLKNSGVSRSELSDMLDLDIRTTGAYLENMLHRGLIINKKETTEGRGRPALLYYPNTKNLLFGGIGITRECLSGVLTDISGETYKDSREAVTFKNESKLTFFNKLRDLCVSLINRIKKKSKIPAGIGIGWSRWLQDPLYEHEIFSFLKKEVETIFNIPVYKELPIITILYRIKILNPRHKNIAILHPGIMLEAGVMLNGEIPKNIYDIEHEIQHLPVNNNGDKCFCGNIGCLENEITLPSLVYRYNKIHGGNLFSEESLTEMAENFYNKIRLGDKNALKILNIATESAVKGIEIIFEKYRPDRLYFLGNKNIEYFFKFVSRYIRERNIGIKNIELCKSVYVDSAAAAGCMAAYRAVGHFIK